MFVPVYTYIYIVILESITCDHPKRRHPVGEREREREREGGRDRERERDRQRYTNRDSERERLYWNKGRYNGQITHWICDCVMPFVMFSWFSS